MSDRYYTPDPRDPRRPGQGSEAGRPRPGRRAARRPEYEEPRDTGEYRPRPQPRSERPAPRTSSGGRAAQDTGTFAQESGGYEPPPGYPEPTYQPGRRVARGKRAAEYPPEEYAEPEVYAEEQPYEPPPPPARPAHPAPPRRRAAAPPPPPERPAFFEEDDRGPRRGRPGRGRGREERYDDYEYDDYEDGYDDYDDFDDRPRRRFGAKGCLAVLLALVVIGGGLAFGGSKGYSWLKDTLAPAADYKGPGSGTATFEVKQGDNAAVMGRNLKTAHVVASVDAYIQAANKNPDSTGIQVGFYSLKQHMKAADVVTWLADPSHVMKNDVTIVEGSRAKAIFKLMSEKTKIPVAAFKQAAKDPAALGLPAYAKGNVEGYLYPATYPIPPKTTAAAILKSMVDRWKQEISDNDVEAQAKKLHYTPEQVMTVASLVQAEGRGDDMSKIARVIYNRLDPSVDGGQTNGRLGIDASNAYGLGKSGTTALTAAELAKDTPYDTRRRKGLPPTPIGSPGADAIQAALNPAAGKWLYYVTVNLKTGETKFATTFAEFQKFNAQYQQYCRTQSKSC